MADLEQTDGTVSTERRESWAMENIGGTQVSTPSTIKRHCTRTVFCRLNLWPGYRLQSFNITRLLPKCVGVASSALQHTRTPCSAPQRPRTLKQPAPTENTTQPSLITSIPRPSIQSDSRQDTLRKHDDPPSDAPTPRRVRFPLPSHLLNTTPSDACPRLGPDHSKSLQRPTTTKATLRAVARPSAIAGIARDKSSQVKDTPNIQMRPPYDQMRRHADARRFVERPFHANHDLYRASRYSSRYDSGDRRSRSPRDRSPDRYERASQYSDGDRRRSSAEARSNTSAFQNNRDSFRDNLPRDPPRGPKALLDPPSGPRGGGYAGDFRGRGRGRGRGWVRDDSRDRGRDRDIDFRDRRDGPYRDERSRERDRDWDRRDRESYRGRPRSPGRGRSPPQRDFRDRDPPLGVDAERSRRGSRDGGPPSAGSSNSDPPFGMTRGGFRGGRDRGRGGWDRGRGRGGFYDDRDRFGPRSRSQEGRWGRDRDERDRGDRWIDSDARRDTRDDRDPRERELLRPKVDRERDRGMSSQAPSPNTKDVSPPPLAPSAPAFGTVPSRNVGAADGSPIIGGTGKLPPTAPRAFNAERPVSAGHGGSGGDFPVPPTGPAKMNLAEGSPPIPSGPRAQQQKQQRPSSKQWINPALSGKKIPESPKIMRSQSFAQQQRPVPFRHDSVPAEQGDYDRRPRSSDANADSHNSATEGSVKSLNLPEPGEIIIKSEQDSYSARGSMDRDSEHPDTRDTVMAGTDAHGYEERRPPSRGEEKSIPAERVTIDKGLVEKKQEPPRPAKESRMSVPRVRFVLPPQEPSAPVSEQTSESDDDEDYGEYFAMEIAKEEAELERLREAADNAPDKIIARYAKISHDALAALVTESEGLIDMLGPVPEVVEPVKEETPAKSPVIEQREKTPQVPSPVVPNKSSPEQAVAAPEPEDAPVPELLIEKEPEQAIVDKETDKTAEKETEKQVDQDAEKDTEKEPEMPTGKPVEKSTPKSSEKPVEKPTEEPIEEPREQMLQKPIEKIAEVAAEDIAEKAPESDVEKLEGPPLGNVPDELQPKTEDMDVDEPAPILSAPSPPRLPELAEDTDIAMEDTVELETPPAKLDVEREEPKEPATNGQSMLLQPPGVPMETIEGDKALPSTPSQMEDDDEDNSTESDDADADAMLIDAIRQYSATPPIDSLPDYSCRAWNRDRDFLESLDSDPMIDDFILQQLDKISLEKMAGQEVARKDYAENYVKYLDFTVSSDPIAVKSRETFISCLPTPEKHVPIPPPPELKPEGRGAGRRYASERDLERVLQASMREDEERKEREQRAMQEKYRSEKEAVIPEMYWTKEDRDAEFFKDTTGFTPVEKLVPAWQILPPINNFTPEEAELFEKRYLTNPKQWGVVAENIPKRNFGTCIQYYYLMKKELNLKEKLKKQPKRRKKGRGKTRSSALVSELGNAENEGEENQENGENGERRRPRRAAAPTWGFEQPPTDSDNATPAGTPGRRGAKGDPEKPDGRKRGRRAAKDKEPKAAKPQQTLAAAPATTSGKGRSRSNSRVQNTEFQPPPPVPMENRLPSQLEVPTTSVQPPFVPAQQPPLVVQERPVPITPSAISEVMAPPSLRPEPPPPPAQPTIATFDIAQPQPERRAQSLLKSFGTDWAAIAGHMGSKTAVMVKNYFVRQRDQGKTEWEQFAAEADGKRSRGEKLPDPPPPTVGGRKKYDSTPASSHRPLASAPATPAPPVTTEPPSDAPATKVETPVQQPGNPPFGRFTMPITPAPPPQPQQQQQQQQQQPLAQAPPPPPTATQAPPPQAPQQTPVPVQQQHPATQPVVTQSGSPIVRPLRAPPQQAFGFQERERETTQPPQPVRISQKPSATPATEPVQQRPLAAAQPIQPAQPEPQIDRQQAERQQQMERQAIERQQMERQQLERQRMEQQQMERQQIERQQIERQQIERQQIERQQIERQQMERQQLERQAIERQQIERQQLERQQMERQQAERQQMERQQMERQKMEAQQSKEHLRPTERTRLKQEPEMTPPHHHYEPFSYGQQPVRNVPPPRSEPAAVSRQPAEPSRSTATPVPQSYGQPMPQPGGRLLGDPQPPVSTPPGQRPIAAQRPMPTHMDSYGTPPQQPQPPPNPTSRPSASERKTSNIMSLLNDDPPSAAAAAAPTPPPQPKRLNDMAQLKPSPTPPPQSMSRGPAPPPAPTPLRPEREPPQAYPYGRNAPSASTMPPLKPTYTASPQAQHMSAPRSAIASPHDAAAAVERDYYRQYQSQATNSPQIAQPYPPQSQPPRDAYQPQTGYPGYGAPTAHAGSPPPQYAVHQSASRREPPPPQSREPAWPPGPQGHAMGQPQPPQQQSSWPPASHGPPPKQPQQAPPPQNWASPHMSAQKAPPASSAVPQQSWASGPPQQQQQQQHQQHQQPPPHHHMSMRDDRGASMYGQIPPQHQHAMQGRYPPVSRAPEPMPPQAQQAYPPRYASTPAPRDPRDQMPPRSYTPVGYDTRGPPPGPYPPDPREMQMREMSRDPRDPRDPREIQQQEMLQRQLRPHDGYGRQSDRYGR
ncbi:myb-like dna-binding domain-containing protein [Colletotrichum incanum]|uniref:Myb-like dna-binding domain-containing protein n=1 Tax=Colletotrichum incanum TaxID=1573173 RepID=A0A161W7P1_COLIC|nr:myb-like dna-binding domain-containing protein [Colletotrichum incanum]